MERFKHPPCAKPIWSPTVDRELMERTFVVMKRRNVYGVASGSLTEQWRQALPDRIIAGLDFEMHAGWPMLDDLLAVMWTHPQVHVDVGIISYALPRSGFHDYLRRIVEAGFVKRVMFGSDQMVWPETVETAIQAVESATFLSAAQKRDIFYNNAARFLALSEQEIARHHGR
jgi:predicted TIM-barrel fold metal-dependent hydrolase